jgi:hypothetical protein
MPNPPPGPGRPGQPGNSRFLTVPQAWHSPHRPLHLADCQPHSVHR